MRITEALFPGYFFARFSLRDLLPLVRSAHGVLSIVRFGTWYPVIDNSTIEELQVEAETSLMGEVVPELAPGDRVRLVAGPLAGLEAVITHVLPGHERVKLLLEFLGGNTLAEARSADVIPYDQFGSTMLRFATRVAAPGRGKLSTASIPKESGPDEPYRPGPGTGSIVERSRINFPGQGEQRKLVV